MKSIHHKLSSENLDSFSFDVSETVLEIAITSFTNWLSNYIEQGAVFIEGQTLQYGYSLLYCSISSRSLKLLAPDFRSMPIKWQADLSSVFMFTVQHKYVPESLGFTPDIPSLGNSLLIGKNYSKLPMFANRLEPVDSNPHDSGWFIGSLDDDVDNNDPDQIEMMSVYEAMIAVPQMIKFLSLPISCQIQFMGDSLVILKDYAELEIPQGSYLDMLLKSSAK